MGDIKTVEEVIVLPMGLPLSEVTKRYVERQLTVSTTLSEAASKLGIATKTLYNWRQRWLRG